MHPAFVETARAIKELRVQGARNVAERALAAIYTFLSDVKTDKKEEVLNQLREGIYLLASSRPTEPALREALAYVLREISSLKDLPTGVFKDALMKSIEGFVQKREEMERRIAEIGANIIDDGMKILTHCHSSTLMAVFRKAAENKSFEVYVTETRPKYQGLKTAKELLEMGIKVVYIVDSAAYYFMRDVDLYMTGADVITADGKVINKVGTALMSVAAHEFGVPHYVTASSLKFDPATILGMKEPIEERDPREIISPEKLPGAEIRNPAFDVTPPKYIAGIISEKGLLTPHAFVALLTKEKSVDPALEEIISVMRHWKTHHGPTS